MPAPSPTTHVRFWKTDLRGLGAVRATLKSAGRHAGVTELGGGGPGYTFNSYIDVPAGHTSIEIYAGTDKQPLRTLSADFVPGEFLTVFFSDPVKADGPSTLELVDDGPATTASTAVQFRVRFFVADLKDARISIGDNIKADFVSPDSYLRLRGIKPVLTVVHTAGTGSSGKAFEWDNDVDFKQHRRQTLLIYPDPYGRIRPRLITDGESANAPASEDGQR